MSTASSHRNRETLCCSTTSNGNNENEAATTRSALEDVKVDTPRIDDAPIQSLASRTRRSRSRARGCGMNVLVFLVLFLVVMVVHGAHVSEHQPKEDQQNPEEATRSDDDEDVRVNGMSQEDQQQQEKKTQALEEVLHKLQEQTKQLDELLERQKQQKMSEEEGDPAMDSTTTSSSSSEKKQTKLEQDDHGIWILESHRSFPVVLQNQQHDADPHGLLLALIHSSDDTACATDVQDKWLTKLHDAAQYVQQLIQTPDIYFGSLDIHSSQEKAAEWLDNVGVDTTPTLVFVVARNFPHTTTSEQQQQQQAFLLDYIGPMETARDVGNTVLQYYLRLFWTSSTPQQTDYYKPFSHHTDEFATQIVPKQLTNLQELRSLWDHQWWPLIQPIARSVQHLPGGVSPKWGPEDYSYIQWLLQQQSSQQSQQTVKLLIQCQSPTKDPILLDLYTSFAELAWVLSSRRDAWFLAIQDCNNDIAMTPAQVAVYSFSLQDRHRHARPPNWNHHPIISDTTTSTTMDDDHDDDDDDDPVATAKHRFRRFLVQQVTPSVLWFDRYATAPIAFANDYKVHALLMVNMHPFLTTTNEQDRYAPALQRVLQTFHDECHHQQQQMMCLLVPSTETRILTTLGVDFWTPLDQRATGPLDNEEHGTEPVFPTLFLTDRRPLRHTYSDGTTTTTHGVRRYRLGPPHILQQENNNNNNNPVSQFIQDFWNRRLTPELRSQTPTPHANVNSYGVVTLTAIEFQQRFQQLQSQEATDDTQQQSQQEHALVLFTSPTCGHCKRFHATVFYRVAELLRDLRWDSHMALYMMDVSQNEVHNISIPWLPDVYYFPPPAAATAAAPIRYDSEDDFHNGVGRLRDPMELLEWWLDVMIGGGDWGGAGAAAMDPDVLLDILDDKDVVVEEEQEQPDPDPPQQPVQPEQEMASNDAERIQEES
ncbi:Protein disulfide isomerase [Seminavis robusta]|uniref:protein disulfide-isomerase n=1 Tax=Seminavis robusta TaxID=568900 RepID=A0A9N8DFA5_9STRA|nr:Protein disulfide isomerase [Seminavis robusta]|eukprot:Sro90_g047460.1 Protein disulfide isomerase (933) ;mRNA; f:104864-107662